MLFCLFHYFGPVYWQTLEVVLHEGVKGGKMESAQHICLSARLEIIFTVENEMNTQLQSPVWSSKFGIPSSHE